MRCNKCADRRYLKQLVSSIDGADWVEIADKIMPGSTSSSDEKVLYAVLLRAAGLD